MGSHSSNAKTFHENSPLDYSMQDFHESVKSSAYDDEKQMGFLCCGIIKRQSQSKPKWRCNFELNCEELKEQYKWAALIFQACRHRKENRPQYLKEIDEIKCAFEKEMRDPVAHFPTAEDQAKAKALKEMLKESVIIPAEIGPRDSPSKAQARTSQVRTKQTPINARESIVLNRSQKKPNHRKTKIALMSFVDENLNALFSHKEPGMDTETANILRLFIHFTVIVEKHSNTEGCILNTIKLVFCKFFFDEYGIIDKVTEQTAKNMTQDLKQFIKLYKATICDYYRIALIEQMVPYHQIFRDDNVTNAVTAIVFKADGVYDTVMKVYKLTNQEKEKELVRVLREQRNTRPEDLEIKDQYCLNKRTVDWYVERLSMESGLENVSISAILEYQPYEDCVQKLRQLHTAKTPTGKMKVIMGAAERITRCIHDFYRLNGIVCKPSLLDADQVLTIFSYIVIRSQLTDLHSHLDIVENFSSEDQLMSATGYYYSVILSSVENLTLQQSGQTEITFRPDKA